jgi:hypothetical protein
MPEDVGRDTFADAGLPGGQFKGLPGTVAVERSAKAVHEQEGIFGQRLQVFPRDPDFTPVPAQELVSSIAQLDLALPAAFPVDADHPTGAVHIPGFHLNRLGDAQTRIENEGIESYVARFSDGRQDAAHLLRGQHARQSLRIPGPHQEGNHLGSGKGFPVKEGNGRQVDPPDVGSKPPADHVVFPGPDVIRRQKIQGLAMKLRKESDAVKVLLFCAFGKVRPFHVTHHAVSQETHANPLGCRAVR